MNIRATLLFLAATTLPAIAQHPVPVPQAQEAAVTSPADSISPELLNRRAQVLNSLALLPADIGDFVTLANLGENLTRLAFHSTSRYFTVDDIDEKLLGIDNVTIASSRANAESYAALATLLANFYVLRELEMPLTEWGTHLSKTASHTVLSSVLRHARTVMGSLSSLVEQVDIRPVYAVVSCKPGCNLLLRGMHTEMLTNFQYAARCDDAFEVVRNIKGFSGLRIDKSAILMDEFDLSRMSRDLLGRAERSAPSRQYSQAIGMEITEGDIYLLTKVQGNSLMVVLCDNPEEIHLPDSPAESLLATDMVAEADDKLDKGLFALAHVSNDLLEATGVNTETHIRGIGNAVESLFTTLSSRDKANKAAYEKAAAGARLWVSQLAPWFRKGTQPLTLHAWFDEDLHLSMSADSLGISFEQQPMRHLKLGLIRSTAAYVVKTPCRFATPPPSLTHLSAGAVDIIRGVRQTMNAEDQLCVAPITEVDSSRGLGAVLEKRLPQYAENLHAESASDIVGFAQAISRMLEALDGNAAFIINTKPAQLPPVLGGENGYTVPTVALSLGISNQAAVDKAWISGYLALNSLAFNMGDGSPAITHQCLDGNKGDAFTLSPLNQNFTFTTRMNEKSFVFSNCVDMAEYLAEDDAESESFAGILFMVHPQLLAQSLRDFAECASYGLYYPLKDTAYFMEACNNVAESIIGSVRSQDGKLHLLIDVNLK